ncbi:hypothetical protein [Halocatena pleomorpha]|uniref:Uncharacterized protein n=1 Tax=Halocatena pleomorpha TaxID=1785090 RepID=A0A3P3R611_9EURY|nr:hypothetical protein [Halocatena pleomorpha]RRJ28921.1 hypothetical protein EIK79_14500 [Halocatena pleomorpha]
MVINDRTRRAITAAVLTWAGGMAVLAVAGLAAGVWRLSDLWDRAGAAFLSEFGLIAIVGTFLLVGGPVFLRIRYALVAPIIGFVCYVAYWAFLGVTTGVGVSALYVGILYGPYALVGIAVLTALEWVVRLGRQRRVESVQ